jgi:hypothetical protein
VLSLVFSAAGSSCWRHGHLNFPNVYMNIYRSVYFTCEAVSLVPCHLSPGYRIRSARSTLQLAPSLGTKFFHKPNGVVVSTTRTSRLTTQQLICFSPQVRSTHPPFLLPP